MYSRSFINFHLRYGTKPLMAGLKNLRLVGHISDLYSKVFFARSKKMNFVKDQFEFQSASVPVTWCSMEVERNDKVILYLHGGGYTIGSLASHGGMVAKIARSAGLKAAFVEFRSALDEPYPAAIDDAFCAYQALLTKGFRGEDIILAGDSAGGGMVFSLLLRLFAKDIPTPLALVALSPLTDLSLSLDSHKNHRESDTMLPFIWIQRSAQAYVAESDSKNPDMSPIFGNFKTPPPTFLAWAEDEILADDGVAISERLIDAGGDVEVHIERELPHVWTLYHSRFEPADRTIAQIGNFIRKQISQDIVDSASESSTLATSA